MISLDLRDIDSPTWQKLQGHLEECLEKERRNLEKIGDDIPHDVIRGKILAYRQLLALGKTTPDVSAGTTAQNNGR